MVLGLIVLYCMKGFEKSICLTLSFTTSPPHCLFKTVSNLSCCSSQLRASKLSLSYFPSYDSACSEILAAFCVFSNFVYRLGCHLSWNEKKNSEQVKEGITLSSKGKKDWGVLSHYHVEEISIIVRTCQLVFWFLSSMKIAMAFKWYSVFSFKLFDNNSL